MNEGTYGQSDAGACSRSSDTPETDELAAVLIHPDSLMSFRKYIKRSLKLCRKLERQRDEALEQARNADLRVTRVKRERDGAWAKCDRLANAITNAAGVLSSDARPLAPADTQTPKQNGQS